MKRLAVLLMFIAAVALAHPMGNFSVSHYARLEVAPQGVNLVYALDLAEIPTFELLRSWDLERTSPREQLDAKAREQARAWLNNLEIDSGDHTLSPRLLNAELVISDGAGNLPVARITARARLKNAAGTLAYEDRNFPDRAGWKEIVILALPGITLRRASQTNQDLSNGLTQYPPDPTLAPPQDLRAALSWSAESPVLADRNPRQPAPVRKTSALIKPIPQPQFAPAPVSPATRTAAAAPRGSVVRGDFLSRLLRQGQLSLWMILTGLAIAFVLGGAHALTPGHGKTIVAAYLVGSRGTLKHAAFLGAMVTFTHTISVFVLGIVTLFFFRLVTPERVTQWLGVVSGLSIVAIGLWMMFKRFRSQPHHHRHGHSHPHGAHTHTHHHDHTHDHHHEHPHEHQHHHHGNGGHSHIPDEMSWGGLIALGASGGLVPCESALVLLLGAIALGRVGLGLLLLLSFSAGLAIVLMAVGAIVLYAKNLLPERKHSKQGWVLRYVPIASAAAVTVIGIVMTGVSLGWIRSGWMIG